jgi:hypothetical protein
MSKEEKTEPKFDKSKVVDVKGLISIDNFMSNSKKVKQFSKLNEVAFKRKFMILYKKDPKSNPYLKTVSEWEALFQKMVGVDFKILK